MIKTILLLGALVTQTEINELSLNDKRCIEKYVSIYASNHIMTPYEFNIIIFNNSIFDTLYFPKEPLVGFHDEQVVDIYFKLFEETSDGINQINLLRNDYNQILFDDAYRYDTLLQNDQIELKFNLLNYFSIQELSKIKKLKIKFYFRDRFNELSQIVIHETNFIDINR